ncbi:MAG: RNA ligase RtcB family protein [Desulfobacteraceae bacterium]
MIVLSNDTAKVWLIASDQSWIEGDAIRQLQQTARLNGMFAAVGLPDLHPGKGGPVGAAFLSRNVIYPNVVGSDVGCGMGLWQTALKTRKVKRDKWAKRLRDLNLPWEGDQREWLRRWGLDSSDYDMALGTLGGGNHFAELQRVEQVHCRETFLALGLDRENFFLLVHSGSRGIGQGLLRQHAEQFGAGGLVEGTGEMQRYMKQHDFAVQWAKANRWLIAKRICDQLNTDGRQVLDVSHNFVQKVILDGETAWLHRKGAARSDAGPVIIPGSRGALSYLVMPVGDQQPNLWSLAHGAGRKWTRKSCRQRLKSRTRAKALTHTELGSVVICDDRELLYEEAPQAYKNIGAVIADMAAEGCIQVIATLRPLITYKTRRRK